MSQQHQPWAALGQVIIKIIDSQPADQTEVPINKAYSALARKDWVQQQKTITELQVKKSRKHTNQLLKRGNSQFRCLKLVLL